jgi:hypothetical protein
MPVTESESAKRTRLEERVLRDPSSALFLPLAELYRQEGRATDAERVLRAGLRRHKERYSARTALGRILLELGRPEEAALELESVHRAVPENLLAARLLEEARRGQEPAPAPAAAPVVAREVPDRRTPDPTMVPEDRPVDTFPPAPDPSVQPRVAALRRFLAGASSLRGHHA